MHRVTTIKRARNESLLDAKERQHRKAGVVKRARVPVRALGSPAAECRSTSAREQTAQPKLLNLAVTKVTARIDVGFGNQLFIRGQGNGLSWDQGQPLTCLDGAAWVWSAGPAQEESVFKLLLNDQIWCHGENIRVGPGAELEVVPSF